MPLSVEVGGNTSKFESAMARAQAVATVTAGEMRRRFTDAAEGVASSWAVSAAKFAVLPAAALAGLILGMKAIGKASEEAREKLEGLVKIANASEKAGTGSDFFQRWVDRAHELNSTIPELTAMLNKAREASTVDIGREGKDPTSKIVDQLDLHAKAGNIAKDFVASFKELGDQESRIRAILTLLQQLANEGKNLAAFDLAKTFFGADFETKMRNGVDVVGRMKDSLDGIGKVQFSPEMLAQAKEIDDKIANAERTLRDGWAPIQRDILSWQLQQASSWADMKQTIADLVAILGRGYEWLTGWMNRLTDIGNLPIWRTIANALPSLPGNGGVVDAPPGGFPVATAPTPNVTGIGDKSRNLPSTASPSAKDTNDATTSLERYTQQLQKANAEAQTQAEFVGKSNSEYQVALALAKARVASEKDFNDGLRDAKALTEAEVANITHLAEVMEKAKTAAKQFGELQSFSGRLLVDSLMAATEAGAKFSDIMKDVTKSIARAALNALILGQGPLAGLFGTGTAQSGQVGGLFGAAWNLLPKFQDGGVVPGTGPRLAVVHGGEVIVPPNLANSAMGGSTVVSINQTVDARGAQIGVAEQIAAALAANNQALRTNLPGMIRDARSRSALS